jgi:cytosine/adenosine deaminase-related metal-dependent hydrolase
MTHLLVRAAWAVPVVSPPIRDAWVAIADGRIAEIGGGPTPAGVASRYPPEIDLGPAALLPGLVNAHTHLELSGLRGAIPPAPSMPAWVRTLLRVRQGSDDRDAIETALDEAIAFGTAAFGDVTNTLAPVGALCRRDVHAVIFHELLGFDPALAEARLASARARLQECRPPARVRLRLAPHAPYSTSADLIRALAAESRSAAWPPTSIHVAESADETTFLAAGEGEWARLHADLGTGNPRWQPPGTSAVPYLDGLGVWQPGVLAVHGVQLQPADLDLLASRDVTLVTCPRSNRWVGAGVPPIAQFVASGIRMAVGTDSLASAPDLNLFEELRALRQLAPEVPARTLLSWATVNGAVALGLGNELGSLAPGRLARILAVRGAREGPDIEERLIGVDAADVRWLEDAAAGVRPTGAGSGR